MEEEEGWLNVGHSSEPDVLQKHRQTAYLKRIPPELQWDSSSNGRTIKGVTKMFKQVTIQADQRGLLFHKGSYVKKLNPGTYRYVSWSQNTVVVLNVAKPFVVEGKELQLPSR